MTLLKIAFLWLFVKYFLLFSIDFSPQTMYNMESKKNSGEKNEQPEVYIWILLLRLFVYIYEQV